eukprot:2934611-Pyramimonas_sp.AAC.1
MALMGSAGQPAESDFDSGTDTDASSDDEATALDYFDMPTLFTEKQQAQWLLLGQQKHKRRWRRFTKKPVRKVLAETAGAHQAKAKGDGGTQRMPTVKLRSATYAAAHNISDANALE